MPGTSAVPGTTYTYKVRAIFKDGTASPFSEAVTITAVCPQVTKLAVGGDESGRPLLTWAAVNGANGYAVYRSESADGEFVKVASVSTTKYADTAAENGKTYYYYVIAVKNDAAYGLRSDVVSTTVELTVVEPVVGARQADGKPTLHWNKLQNAVSYQVYRATEENGEYVRVFTTKGLTYTHVSAQLDKTYYYKVKAVFSDGSTVFSEILSNTCTCGRPEVTVGHRAADGLPRLKWAPVDGAQSYAVYRATKADGKYVRVFKTTGTTYTHISAQPDTTYYYKVVAVTPQGHTGVFSEVLKASIQTP